MVQCTSFGEVCSLASVLVQVAGAENSQSAPLEGLGFRV